jgi:hypothetical protein
MKLFIANCSHQIQLFSCRVPEERKPRSQPIFLGRQIQLSGELTMDQIEAVIGQHTKYGGIVVTVAHTYRGYAPIVFSIGKPVPAKTMNARIEMNRNVLQQRGQQFRTEAAIAASTYIKNQILRQEDDDPANWPKAIEMEMVEEPAKTNPHPVEFSEKIAVPRQPGTSADEPAKPRRRRSSSAADAA